MRTRIEKALIVRALGLLLFVAVGRAFQQQHGPVWESVLRSSSSELECVDAAASGTTAWLLLNVRPKGMLGGPLHYRVAAIGASGATLLQFDIGGDSGVAASGGKLTKVFGIAAMPAGNRATVVGEIRPGQLGLAFLDTSGKSRITRVSPDLGPDVYIARVLSSSNGLIAVGRSGRDAAVFGIRLPDGAVAITPIPGGEARVLNNAILLDDGTLVVAGLALQSKGPIVWIGRREANGKLTGHQGDPAFDVRIARADGGFTAAYAKDAANARSLVFKRYAPLLGFQSSSESPVRLGFNMRFDIAAPTARELLFAAADERLELVMGRLNRDGKLTMIPAPRTEGSLVWNIRIVPMEPGALIIRTVMEVDELREQRQFVRITPWPR